MLRSLAVPFLASLLAPLAPVSAQSEDAARLIPADARMLVRVQSTQALNEFVRAFAPLGGGAASFDLQATLNGLLGQDAAGGVTLDPALPLYLAVTLDAAAGPALTMVLPVSNGQPLQFQGGMAGPFTNVTLGRYTGASNVAGYAAAALPSPLVAALRPGLVSAHVDLKAILALYRPLLEMGLQQAEASLDTLESDEMPFDAAGMMEAYLAGVRTVLDSAEALDLGCARSGDEVSFQLDFRAAAGSKLDGWAEGPSADLTQLAGVLDPASSIQILFNRNWMEYWESFEDLIDAALECYPEPLRSDMRALITAQVKLGELLQPGLAGGADFTPQGMHAMYVLSSSKPAEFLAGVEAALVELDRPGALAQMGPAESWSVDGLEARVLPLTLDYSSLQAMIEDLEPAGGAGDFAEFQRAMESMYGRDLRLLLAAQGDLVLLGLGSDDALLKIDLARLRAPVAPGPGVQRLLERIPPSSAGFAYHIDFGQAMSQMFEAVRAFLPTQGLVFPSVGASFDFWGSVQGRTWTGGIALSVQELLGFVQSMQALEQQR